jgi:hypothetical protein
MISKDTIFYSIKYGTCFINGVFVINNGKLTKFFLCNSLE